MSLIKTNNFSVTHFIFSFFIQDLNILTFSYKEIEMQRG